jgi:8-oxo-dGTP pyrophosphatase MutT (NUDIX family)
VKLVLLDESDRMLLINAADPSSGELHWYPVGGGVEAGESLQEAACREAREEVGLLWLPPGTPVWTRDHTYSFDGRSIEVHEDWLLHRVPHFEPAPAALSDYEARTVRGFRWWYADELAQTGDTVFPPDLGVRLAALLRDGPAGRPVDIGAAAGR